LSRKDAARVEKALASDKELARRFDLVREELGETIRLNESLGAPSARAMKTLFEKIDAESPAVRAVSSSVSLTTRISELFQSLSPRTLAYGGIAAALAIVLQAGVITGVMLKERGGEGAYRTVAIEQNAAAAQGSFALVRFAPEANAADITKLLEDQKASIVSGPSAGGIYRVKVALTGLPKDDLARAVKQLQDNKAVSFAAPAQ
jgi:anti-sigma factor RsiW